MTSATRFLKTNPYLTILLCVVTASAIYLSTSRVNADNSRKAKATKAKLLNKAKQKKATLQQAQPASSPASPGGAGLQSDESDKNSVAEELERWMENNQFEFGERKGEVKKADEPDKALQYFLRKRLPEGETDLPVEKYFQAMQEMQLMNVFSTADNRFVSREDLKNSPEQPKLGTWTALGPGNIGGRTRSILINPNDPNLMYAAGVAGGIWKSTNAGASWTPTADLIANIAVTTMAFDPKNPNTIYAGTGEGFQNFDRVRGAGIFKSIDAGTTWARLPNTGTPDFYFVNDIIVSTNDSKRLYAATSTGVWRSTDEGLNWLQVLPSTVNGGCLDLAARTDVQTDYVFASCGNLQQSSIYQKTAAETAGNWDQVLTESGMGRTAIAIAPSNQNVVYAISAALSGTYQHGLYAFFRSDSGGGSGTWTARVRNTDVNKVNTAILSNVVDSTAVECKFGTGNSFTGQSWYDLTIAVDPQDFNRVWVGGIDVFRSDDGGLNWGAAAFAYDGTGGQFIYGRPNQLHPDQHFITFHPQFNGTSNQQIFIGNDGGIWRSDNARAQVSTGPRAFCDSSGNKVQWTPLNNNYGVTQFHHGSVYPDGKTYFGGTQDNGTPRGNDTDGPNKWKQIYLADGGYSAVDFLNTNTIYASTQNAGFVKSTDGGATFSATTLGRSGSFSFITPMLMDPSDPARLYTGGSLLLRSDKMTFWSNLGSPQNVSLSSGLVSALAVAPTDANYALIGLSDGAIVRTTRALGLSSINQLSASIESFARPRTGTVSWVAFDPNDRNIAYATYSTFGGSHVWKTTNAGQSWAAIDGTGGAGIPDIPVHCIVADPSNSARLYVGSDLGVFVSLDGGATWTVENTGFANVVTESLVLNVANGVTSLYAFTHGRGAFKVTANNSGCNFALSKTGNTVAAGGSDLTVDVTVTPGGCAWRAESNASWITLQPGAGGSANGTVGMKVTANPGIGPRYGTVNIAGRSFTVTQAGAPDLDSPTLAITSPTTSPLNTPNALATITGTATDNVRVASVSWRSNRGQSGAASSSVISGTINWSFAVTLLAGANEFTFIATDDTGNVSVARTLTVNVAAPSSLLTVAGTGTNGFSGDNGQAISANISRPIRMTFDAAGNLFFADLNNNRVRRVTPNGIITTIAGTGTAGFSGDNGPATSAQLNGPLGVALDRNGNLLIADAGNNRIRRINASTGVISTVAGTGDTGFNGDGGAATAARISAPENVFVDKDNNIFIADFGNNRIRKVAANGGTISTVAGTGTSGFSGDGGQATAATLSSPTDVAVDNAGNIYICAAGNNRIRKVTTDGVINTIAGNGNTTFNGDGILATAAAINGPQSIALDSAGNVYITDRGNSRIRKVTVSSDSISTLAGGSTGLSPDGSSTTGARLNLPTGIALDSVGNVFFSDRDNFRIRRIANAVGGDTAGPVVAINAPAPAGTFTATANPLALSGSATDAGAVTVVRWSNDRGGNGTATGTTSWSIPLVSLQPGVNNLTITAWDASGNAGSAVLIANYQSPQVLITIAGTGIGSNSADEIPGTAAAVWQPRDLVVDPAGNVIFTDNLNRRVRKISPTGVITAFAGTGEAGSGGDGGQAKNATLSSPGGIAIDSAGNVYISDQDAHRVRKVAPDGIITTVAGTGVGFGGFSGDGGLAKNAELNFPQGLAVDKDGNLLIADLGNNRIRKVTIADGKITTIAGTGLYGYSGDGLLATDSDLANPTGVTVDGAGNIYIADLGNQRIRKIAVADKKISTIAGTGTSGFTGDDGPAVNARINLGFPAFLSVDSAGDVYFADSSNRRIRKITINSGIITTVAGTGLTAFNGDGTSPTGTNLAFPSSVAVDSSGTLYIADLSANRVRRTRPSAGLRAVTTVSAASFSQTAGVASEEIVSGFGPSVASTVVVASSLPLPTSLGGTTVKVRDSLNVDRLAPLFFVSPDQVNYQIPSGTAAGLATVIITNAAGETVTGTVTVANVAPSLFTANSSGTGPAAADVFRRNAAGVDTIVPVSGPIDLGPSGDIVLLIAYGTGMRGFTDLSNVKATIGGVNAPIFFVGPTPGYVGLDQANMLIDRSLIGKGTVDVVLTIDGKVANTVSITIK
ncbi:MAG TPA: BACON domain-containing carbohydrate-binding protein [Blastocatellia bacterium]|nr:BACON domain-containing carbohydrate-binding protein [Blastocatellia bacterium]